MIITDLIIIICLMLSAFFSGMEIAFVSSNKIYLEIEKQQSGINARLLSFITKNPSRFIATMLVGNNISLVIYGIFIGDRILQMMFPSTLQDLSFSIVPDPIPNTITIDGSDYSLSQSGASGNFSTPIK